MWFYAWDSVPVVSCGFAFALVTLVAVFCVRFVLPGLFCGLVIVLLFCFLVWVRGLLGVFVCLLL